MNIPDLIIQSVCKVFKLSQTELLGRSRLEFICDARYAAFTLLFRYGMRNKEIGILFNRGSDTIRHGRRVATQLLQTSEHFQKRYDEVYNLVQK